MRARNLARPQIWLVAIATVGFLASIAPVQTRSTASQEAMRTIADYALVMQEATPSPTPSPTPVPTPIPVVRSIPAPRPPQAPVGPPEGDVARALWDAWPGANKAQAVSVAKCESKLNPRAISSTGDYGILQINRKAHSGLVARLGYRWEVEMLQIGPNVQVAWMLYKSRGNWGDWAPSRHCHGLR